MPRRQIARLVAFVGASEGAAIADVDVAVVDRRKMAAINRRYLGHSGATDVISFNLSESPESPVGGQIIVCGPVAVAEAHQRGLGVQRELLLYVLHGLLHLLGYDDRRAADAAGMTARQEELLARFLGG